MHKAKQAANRHKRKTNAKDKYISYTHNGNKKVRKK